MELSIMKLNDNKAGMQSLDTDKINQIIKEASQGSKFYQHKLKSQDRINAKISELQAKLATFSEEQLSVSKKKMDSLAAQLELSRDLTQTIVHVDMDAFYAAVEMRDNPDLIDKPMAVGGLGMLSTSNYLARRFGVRAAMPGFIGKKLCPHLVIVAPNFDKYTRVAQEIQTVFAEYDPNFSAMSLDEAYLNITRYLQTAQQSSPQVTASETVEEMRRKIFEKTQLTASAGIAANTMLAKVCSDKNKPNGQFLLLSDIQSIRDFVAKLPIRKVCGIGNVTEQLLGSLGVVHCQDLWIKRDVLGLLFSEVSYEHFLHIALGLGGTELGTWTERDRKSVSSETTFAAQSDPAKLLQISSDLSQDLAADLKRKGLLGRAVTLKLKTDAFDVKTRVQNLLEYTNDAKTIAQTAHRILLAEIHSQKPGPLTLRLLGVRMSNLCPEQAVWGGSGKRQKTLEEMLSQNKRLRFPIETFPSSRQSVESKTEVDVRQQGYQCPVCNNVTAENLEAFNDHLDQCLGLASSDKDSVTHLEAPKLSSALIPVSSIADFDCDLALPSTSDTLRCPVCGKWQTCLGEAALNQHLDECLNEPLLKRWQKTEPAAPELKTPSLACATKNINKYSSTQPSTGSSSSKHKKSQGKIPSSFPKQIKLDSFVAKKS